VLAVGAARMGFEKGNTAEEPQVIKKLNEGYQAESIKKQFAPVQ
jgi:hypothetical protein